MSRRHKHTIYLSTPPLYPSFPPLDSHSAASAEKICDPLFLLCCWWSWWRWSSSLFWLPEFLSQFSLSERSPHSRLSFCYTSLYKGEKAERGISLLQMQVTQVFLLSWYQRERRGWKLGLSLFLYDKKVNSLLQYLQTLASRTLLSSLSFLCLERLDSASR